MIKKNDSKLYLYFSLITCIIGVILAMISFYSIFIVEPEIDKLLNDEENIIKNYPEAYIMLKDPQIFARYENYDNISRSIKPILRNFDDRIKTNKRFDKGDKIYLETLFERRKLGSLLGKNTMIFFFLLSILGWGFYFYEVRH